MTHYYLNIKNEIIECNILNKSDEDYYLITNEKGCDVWLLKSKVKVKKLR
jgi:hypothetical protein|tara:strand:- start:531 stop:680 length:150 start_codon:yes stop_codon:yes gene_type:complete